MRTTSSLVALLFLALPLGAANLTYIDRPITKIVPIDLAGTLWVDNPFGTVEISGVDGTNATITAVRTTIAVDHDSMVEARDNTVLSFEGDVHQRIVRTLMPPQRSQRWSSSVKYTISVPRTVHLRVATKAADTIRVANIMGNVTVKAFSGTIVLDNVNGASIIDAVNGRVVYNFPTKPVSNAQVNAVNANIEVHLPADSNIDWVADTLRGDVWTSFQQLRGRWTGRVFSGSLNASGGPRLTTATMLGRVALLANGATGADAQSVLSLLPPLPAGNTQPVVQQMSRIQLATIPGPMEIVQRVADVNVGEARGPLRVFTGGAIELGTVYGDCTANASGGITITEAKAGLNAHSGGGDIVVRTARNGGTILTDGGSVKVEYTGGPTTLRSGGGDIIVRQAGGPIDAETRSGDITVGSDPNQKTQHIAAHTARGNITLHLSPRFGADVDATVLTSDSDNDAIYSDFKGLQIRKDQVGGKTRFRATGKINGGGERLELYSEEGTIHINAGLKW